MDREAWKWLVLQRLPDTGPVILNRLLDRFDTVDEILNADPADLQESGLPASALAAIRELQRHGDRSISKRRALADCKTLRALDVTLLSRDHNDYPPLLREIHQAPPLLYLRGALELPARPAVAIVGSRKATAAGKETAFRLAEGLASAGLLVCSGLALGIDAAAHEGALSAGGFTAAVTAVGIDRSYPLRHAGLERRILDSGGVILTEFPPGTAPRPDHFPRRNRIISGLCQGVVVVESALRSGSLITARLALEQGREVFAVPGSVRSPQSRGCHALLRDGARLVESAEDVLEELFGLDHLSPTPPGAGPGVEAPQGLGAAARQLWQLLEAEAASVEELAQHSGLGPSCLQAAITELELFGYVGCEAGLYSRR